MRVTVSVLSGLLCTSAFIAVAHPAAAFDPNTGANDSYVGPARFQPLPDYVVPRRYYRNPNIAYVPPSYRPAAPAPTPVVVAASPAVIAPRQDIYETPPSAPAPVYAAAPAIVYAPTQPAPAPVYAAAPPAPAYLAAQPAKDIYEAAPQAIAFQPVAAPYYATPQPVLHNDKVNQYSLGIEGFWDRYREHQVDLESNTGYGALDAGWTHYFSPRWFTDASLRAGYGKEDYKSGSGHLDGTDDWEYEGRLVVGTDIAVNDGAHVKPYAGLDLRYYRDDGKGEVTDLGAHAYDRRILQLMAPIGVTYDMLTPSGYHIIPTVEAGPLIFGNVSTRLENIPGFYQVETQQHVGYELRTDLMINDLNAAGRGWEFGPFMRYYHMSQSNTGTTPPTPPLGNTAWVEPENTRLQVGAKLGYLF